MENVLKFCSPAPVCWVSLCVHSHLTHLSAGELCYLWKHVEVNTVECGKTTTQSAVSKWSYFCMESTVHVSCWSADLSLKRKWKMSSVWAWLSSLIAEIAVVIRPVGFYFWRVEMQLIDYCQLLPDKAVKLSYLWKLPAATTWTHLSNCKMC